MYIQGGVTICIYIYIHLQVASTNVEYEGVLYCGRGFQTPSSKTLSQIGDDHQEGHPSHYDYGWESLVVLSMDILKPHKLPFWEL